MVLYGIFFLYLYNIYTHCLVCQQRLLMGFYMKLNIKISKMGILMPHLLIVDFKQFFGFFWFFKWCCNKVVFKKMNY